MQVLHPIRTAGILLFPEVEPLDFAGPFEVFAAARPEPASGDRLMKVITVAETPEPVTCRYNLKIVPDYQLEMCPPLDVLVVPGGIGTRTAVSRQPLIQWILERASQAGITMSVCTGSFLLAQAGLLNGRTATSHWTALEDLRNDYPFVDVRGRTRFTDNGKILTSAGVSAGIDLALHVLERLYGSPVAQATAEGIEYEHYVTAAAAQAR